MMTSNSISNNSNSNNNNNNDKYRNVIKYRGSSNDSKMNRYLIGNGTNEDLMHNKNQLACSTSSTSSSSSSSSSNERLKYLNLNKKTSSTKETDLIGAITGSVDHFHFSSIGNNCNKENKQQIFDSKELSKNVTYHSSANSLNNSKSAFTFDSNKNEKDVKTTTSHVETNKENNFQSKKDFSNTKPTLEFDLAESTNNNKNNSNFVKYGELIVLGHNGCINNSNITTTNGNLPANSSSFKFNEQNITRRKSKYILKQREKCNGVKPATQHNCQTPQEVNNLISKNRTHSVTYTLSRNHTVVVQYIADEKTDMFQIGRSSESAIDFIILDTIVPNVSASSTPSSLSPASSLQSNQSNSSNQHSNSHNQQHQQPNSNLNNNILNNQQSNNHNQQSTISRYSCRICIDRDYPYTARIYAAGFDSSNSIFLGEKATKWKNDKGELDGVTTNGVLIMHPTDGFIGENSNTNEWMEVSVCGAVFSLNESRLTPCLMKHNKETRNRSNILRDGTLIDLCGATLLWRSVASLEKTATKHYLNMNLENLNRLKPQCPVGLKTLVFPSISSPLFQQVSQFQNCFQTDENNQNNKNKIFNHNNKSSDRVPMVYLKCGHVHGVHDWGIKKDNERECPLCRKVGPYVQLLVGLEPSIYNDIIPTNKNPDLMINNKKPAPAIFYFKPYAFRPCGHMASEETCKYWSRILVPQGTTQGLSSICPFCAIPLCKEQPFVKLILQEGAN